MAGKKRDRLMLNFEKIFLVRNGELPTTTKVGRLVTPEGNWKAVFCATNKAGEVMVNAEDEVMFNIV